MVEISSDSQKLKRLKGKFLEVKGLEKDKPTFLEVKKEKERQAPLAGVALETIGQEEDREIFKHSAPNYTLSFNIRNEGLELTATIEPKTKGKIIIVEDMLKYFKQKKLVGTIDRDALRAFCQKACRGEPERNVLLMQGGQTIFTG